MAAYIRQMGYLPFRSYSTYAPSAAGKLLCTEFRQGVQHLILNSPKTRNAMSLEMLRELSAAFDEVSSNGDVRCVLLSAEGHVFSAGHNLKELTDVTGREHHKLVFSTCTGLMKRMLDCPVPVVARVDGVAAAAGSQLIATCDIVIASTRSKFSTPGVSLGLFCSTPGVAVARAVPLKTANYMLYTGLPITANEAISAGLVSRVVAAEDLHAETERVVESILQKSNSVVRLGKQFLKRQISIDTMQAYREGEQVMADNLQLDDAKEGINSFVGKRKPIFKH